MTKQTIQATKSLIKQPTVQLFQTNPTIQYSNNSFSVKPTKMLSDCGGRGLRPDPPSPTGINLLPGARHSALYKKSVSITPMPDGAQCATRSFTSGSQSFNLHSLFIMLSHCDLHQGRILLVPSLFSRLSSVFGRLQNPVPLALRSSKIKTVDLEGLSNLLLLQLEGFAEFERILVLCFLCDNLA